MKITRHAISLAACFSLLFATPIFAISSGGIGGRPAHPDPENDRTKSIFIYNLEAGQTKQDSLLVSNTTDDTADIELYAVDAILTPTGDMTCKQNVEPKDDVGSWIKLSKSELTLSRQSSQVVDFTVQIPSKVDVGEHNGCMIIQRKTQPTEQTGGVQLQTRQAVRVAIIVPGDIHRDTNIKSFQMPQTTPKQTYSIAINNTGNVSVDAKVMLSVKDMFGNVVYENGGTYATLADSTRSFNYSSEINSWHGGFYTAELKLQYDKRAGVFGATDESQLVTKQAGAIKFFLWPQLWVIILAVVLLLLIVSLIIWFIIKRRKRSRRANQRRIKRKMSQKNNKKKLNG